MQGFIRRRIPLFLRRAITMAPALLIIALGVDASRALVLSQVVLSFGIPFALIPLRLVLPRPLADGRARQPAVDDGRRGRDHDADRRAQRLPARADAPVAARLASPHLAPPPEASAVARDEPREAPSLLRAREAEREERERVGERTGRRRAASPASSSLPITASPTAATAAVATRRHWYGHGVDPLRPPGHPDGHRRVRRDGRDRGADHPVRRDQGEVEGDVDRRRRARDDPVELRPPRAPDADRDDDVRAVRDRRRTRAGRRRATTRRTAAPRAGRRATGTAA